MSIFSKFLKQIQTARTAFVNGDAASAAAGSMIYVAKSGGISDSEFDMLVNMMKSNPRFDGLDVDKLVAKWEGYASDRMAKRDLMELLSNMKGVDSKQLCEDVLISAIEVADAEGEEGQDNIDQEEMIRLDEIATALGLNLNSYV